MEYTILVMSCDKNHNLLDCFFKYFSKNFKDYDGKIYLSMEKEDYRYEGLDIKTIYGETNSSWSNRLLNALDKIENKAVLLMLDDFIIESQVNYAELNKIAEIINKYDEIAHFALTTVSMKNASNSIYFDRYYERDQFGRYKTTLQCGMWNKSELKSLLLTNENAWEIEIFANIRSFVSCRKYYAIAKKEDKPIDYNDGLFCIQGKINYDEMSRLEKKLGDNFLIEGIEINKGIIVRDNIPLTKRTARRLKIVFLYIIYRLKYILKKKKIYK